MNRRDFTALLLTSAAAGCGLFDEKKTPLPGERIAVLGIGGGLDPDPSLAAVPVVLPPPEVNPAWPVPGGVPTHAIGHPALPDRIGRAWTTSIGEGSSRYTRILSTPVVSGGRVFAMDGAAQVSALDAATGGRIWAVDLKPEDQRGSAFGGGPCLWNDRLFLTTGYGQVVALDPADGRVIWRQNVTAPLHAPPTVTDGRVFAVSVENALDVLSADDGRRLWTHNGIPETAGLLGGASPAVSDEIVVVGYSSGEVFGLRPENGRVIWSDNLAVTQALNAVAGLADIRGRPVIDRGRAYAISHSGRMAAIDLRTGERAWEQQIGSSHGPWVCGDYIFALANDNQAVCVRRDDGKVRWLRPLPRFRDEEDRSGAIYWAGPALGGNRLIVLSSSGEMMSLSPQTGDVVDRQEISGPGYLGPVIAQGALYLLTDDANLSAYRA
jgi:outer membrane protein assembly factor BamB